VCRRMKVMMRWRHERHRTMCGWKKKEKPKTLLFSTWFVIIQRHSVHMTHNVTGVFSSLQRTLPLSYKRIKQ
jgi:hypothetical protein